MPLLWINGSLPPLWSAGRILHKLDSLPLFPKVQLEQNPRFIESQDNLDNSPCHYGTGPTQHTEVTRGTSLTESLVEKKNYVDWSL